MRNLVHESRQGLGWSQQRRADELGMSRQTIISIERGRFDPSLPLAFRLAAILDATLEKLFSGGQPRHTPDCARSSSVLKTCSCVMLNKNQLQKIPLLNEDIAQKET